MNKAILIDPFDQTIKPVDIKGFRDIQRAIQADLFTCVNIGENTLYVDDEGLINGTELAVRFEDEVYPQPLAGRVLILGNGPDGDSADCTLTVKDVYGMVKGILPIRW